MPTMYYDIYDFRWDAHEKTFYADGFDLYDAEGFCMEAFPSGKKQFVIKNYKTGEFRRFTFDKDLDDYTQFVSEDDIKCKVYIGPRPQ
jgi:hypothetical protein